MRSPTQRSLKLLRALDYTVDIAEYWNPFAKRRKDLFGFIDLVALHPMRLGLLAIQTTSGSNVSARVKKIAENKASLLWLRCGNRIHVHGWRTLKKGKARRWYPLIYDMRLTTKGVFTEDISFLF